MTESRQSRYALERAQPVRYIVTAKDSAPRCYR